MAAVASKSLLKQAAYRAPAWAKHLANVPDSFVHLVHAPTPIFPWRLPGVPDDVQLYIKRDDMSGMEWSGNKARKLEFLVADALSKGADCVVTCGGIQSNHARSTAACARAAGLDAYLILKHGEVHEDCGTEGNLLVGRMLGAHIRLVTPGDCAKHGWDNLLAMQVETLKTEGRRPYGIRVGGSNSLGTWGYVNCVEEIRTQAAQLGLEFTDIVSATGSGGTTAGLGLGVRLSGMTAKVHGMGVCDTPDIFYEDMNKLMLRKVVADSKSSELCAEDLVTMHQRKGRGYAVNTAEELEFIREVAATTGVVLDPVYSGKAAMGLASVLREDPGQFRGKSVLFVHTGGLFGLFGKVDTSMLPEGQVQPMKVAGSKL